MCLIGCSVKHKLFLLFVQHLREHQTSRWLVLHSLLLLLMPSPCCLCAAWHKLSTWADLNLHFKNGGVDLSRLSCWTELINIMNIKLHIAEKSLQAAICRRRYWGFLWNTSASMRWQQELQFHQLSQWMFLCNGKMERKCNYPSGCCCILIMLQRGSSTG